MGWIAYVIAWLAAACFWSLASASTAGRSPLETLPWGLLAMGTAAVMGLVVWRLTRRIAWDWRAPSFYLAHGIGLVLYSVVYSTSWVWIDVVSGRLSEAIAAVRGSPVMTWNLLMGSWLYLVVAGLSYAVRAHRRIRAEERAAAEARLLAQQAQLVALRAQVNPHFLFNALHSVGALVASDPVRADKALSAPVPPLIFQPLVENAVRHGIADRTEGGRIALSARVDRARLILRVSDDGGGKTGVAVDGLGLGSVRRRLAALYGNCASLHIDRHAPGFAVTIELPVKSADELGSVA